MKQKNYKVRDKIFATKNSAWGLKPMIVIKLYDNGITATHEDFTSNGYFSEVEVEHFTKQRQIKINKLIRLRKLADNVEKELFKK